MNAGFKFRAQYPTQQMGDDCLAWMDQWATDHASILVQRPQDANNSHSLSNTLHPDSEEGCVVQLVAEYVFEVAGYDEYNTIWYEVYAQVYDEENGVLGKSSCASRTETFTSGV